MSAQVKEEVEPAVRFSRRSLWFGLGVTVLLGAGAALMRAEGQLAAFGSRLFMLLPVVIAIGALALGRAGSKADMRAIAGDELRQFSLGYAYRNGFFAVLLCQPVLVWGGAAPALMAISTIVAGVVAALASVLWYDR